MSDLRQGVTPAGHAALDMAEELRGQGIDGFDWTDLLTSAKQAVSEARSGPLDHRRTNALEAAAKLILAVEQIDAELARDE